MSRDQGHGSDPVRVRLRRDPKDPHNTDARANRSRWAGVTQLHIEEPAQFNPDALEKLCQRIGETRAEAEVARALERISSTVIALPAIASEPDQKLLAMTLRSLVRDADLIGMATLARVARNVQACLGSGDERSYAATLARLQRVGERSIHAVWELEDVPG